MVLRGRKSRLTSFTFGWIEQCLDEFAHDCVRQAQFLGDVPGLEALLIHSLDPSCSPVADFHLALLCLVGKRV